MPISLYDAVVPSQLQILRSIRRLVTAAEAWCAEQGLPPGHVIDAKLAPDMFPFAYQVQSCWNLSKRVIDQAKGGVYSPAVASPPDNFADLAALIDDAIQSLKAIDPADMEPLVGADVSFKFGEAINFDFDGDQFLLSFAQPNFYFHATTAYLILRNLGMEIGKADYINRLRAR
jgi:hypothetical protein